MLTPLFCDNKYSKWYFSIIEFRKQNRCDCYSEKHHIIPQSLGGSNDAENLVKLTAREHFICHLLLVKIVDSQSVGKMVKAAYCMSHFKNSKQQRNFVANSRIYQSLREKFSDISRKSKIGIPRSAETRQKISQSKLGTKHSDSARRKMSESRKGKVPGNKGQSPSQETRDKISAANKGKLQTPEVIENRASKNRGKTRSEETKAKMSLARLGVGKGVKKPTSTCPHCGKVGGRHVMLRYHFEKCKSLIGS